MYISNVPANFDTIQDLLRILGDSGWDDDETIEDLIDELEREDEGYTSIFYDFMDDEKLSDTKHDTNFERYWKWGEYSHTSREDDFIYEEYEDFMEKQRVAALPKIKLADIYL